MGIKTLITILASLSFSVSAFADEMGGEKKPFSIYGDFAGSLSFYDNETNGAANHDDFSVDLVEVNLEKNWSQSKFHLSIGYGQTALAVNPVGVNLNLMNAYYHMMSSYGLGFTFGKFESPVGHETYNHMDNAQYTRSYGFRMAPFFSTGAQVSYAQDMWSVGLIASNGSGKDTDTSDKNKTLALVVDVDPMENLHVDLNYVTGSEGDNGASGVTSSVSIMDVSVAYMINEMFDVALNYISNSQDPQFVAGSTEKADASSMAAYVNANFGMFGLGLRYETFTYDGGFVAYNGMTSGGAFVGNAVTGDDNSISAISLAAKAEIDQNALVMLEYRMDSSDDKIWTDTDGAASDAMNTITASMMYRF